ncbi:transcription factor S-II, central domain-containing protein [Lentinula aff. lateritia]|uniref:Transcription factor S-II, central domain-containing protein n=1 Tax=Lentinula aff. lateritia TaxID=2804960 RepID=A0ACC1U2V0_9AGAR|nr:transcription factor S-II, central domain-containing protein [Lentinula aff. lateritia]
MSDAAELKKLVKQLQGASNVLDIVNILSILKRDHQVNEAILRESKAGLAVGKLRAHESPEVSGAAKELVKKWKTEVEKAKQATASSQAAKPQVPRKASTASNGAITPTATANKIARTAKSDGVKVTGTGDGTRDKCAELLYDGLACDSGAPTELILQRAKAVEVAVLNNIGSTSAAYKSKIRSLFVNLKDKGNPSLREDVVSGDISAEKLAKMSPGDMASAERKAADDKIKQNNLFASLGAEEQQAETDAFQCGRCKQRKCRYRQAQTRSADEPMTTFVTCVNCGNRWKFS